MHAGELLPVNQETTQHVLSTTTEDTGGVYT